MSNRTFVCFACRTTERVPLSRLTRNCRVCRAPAEHVYYKFAIPPKDDDKSWQELLRKVREVNDQIKANLLRYWRPKAERYARIPNKRAVVRRRLRELNEKIAKLERWP